MSQLPRRFAFSLLVVLIAITPIVILPQSRRRAPVQPEQILEKNVRAELSFLASDALQGRGSATNYERVAAEYIGSMFQQFGLEPAGDVDASRNQGFVQRVPLETSKFISAPVLRAAKGGIAKSWEYGRDFLVTGMRVPRIDGELQIIDGDKTPAKGAIAVIRLPSGADPQQRQQAIRVARAAQASAVILIETEANRRQREAGARLPNVPARVAGERATDGLAVFSFRKEPFEELAAIPDGTRIEIAGEMHADAGGSTWNVIGVLRGSDPQATAEAIMLSAHLDHLGVTETGTGDTIFNGADDDASGCVAVLELARVLASGRRPRRTIYFVCFGSEERGGHGARYFIDHSPVALDRMVADITFEMLGRPDAKVPVNALWLTGYERSTLGPELARQGARLVADPHPEQNFFQRSDNYTLALRGVVAHTVSSFGLHSDYHRVTDDVSKIDFPFMTRSINSMIAPIRWLANSKFRPTWLPGKQPARR
jgi:Peptidase family M28